MNISDKILFGQCRGKTSASPDHPTGPSSLQMLAVRLHLTLVLSSSLRDALLHHRVVTLTVPLGLGRVAAPTGVRGHLDVSADCRCGWSRKGRRGVLGKGEDGG